MAVNIANLAEKAAGRVGIAFKIDIAA